jgi:tight adherence protein C
MNAGLLVGGLLGAGLFLVATAQPLGRPRPELAARLRRLSARGRMELDRGADEGTVFSSPLLERLLRPLLDDAGAALARLLARLGLETGDLERRLALAWPDLGPAQFRGQQLASGLVLVALFPAMNLVGVRPFGPWPAWLWLGGFALGFALPAWLLQSRLQQRRAAVAAELPVALDLLAIAASAGLSPEQALLEASRLLRGPLGDGLHAVLADAGVGAAGYGEGLRALAAREDVPELRALADAWRMAQEQGLPLGPAMLALAESVRERRRAHLREEGGKAAVRMLLPVALFIFPVFLVVLLYPAGVELLGLSG